MSASPTRKSSVEHASHVHEPPGRTYGKTNALLKRGSRCRGAEPQLLSRAARDERRRDRPARKQRDEELRAEDAVREQEGDGGERGDGDAAGERPADAHGEREQARDDRELEHGRGRVGPTRHGGGLGEVVAELRLAEPVKRQVPEGLAGDRAPALDRVRVEHVARVPDEVRKRQHHEGGEEAGRMAHGLPTPFRRHEPDDERERRERRSPLDGGADPERDAGQPEPLPVGEREPDREQRGRH